MKNPLHAVTPSHATVKVAVGVALGVALFGGILYLIRRAPDNSLTAPVKKVAEIAATK